MRAGPTRRNTRPCCLISYPPWTAWQQSNPILAAWQRSAGSIRTEYQNTVRDLLNLQVDVTALLPADDSSFGFDNITVETLPPTLLERYLSAAQKISRLAVGAPLPAPGSHVVVLPADRTQERHVEGLPLGTRGGTTVPYTFPLDGDYEIQVRLSRNRNEKRRGSDRTPRSGDLTRRRTGGRVHGDAEPQPDGHLLRGRRRGPRTRGAHPGHRRSAQRHGHIPAEELRTRRNAPVSPTRPSSIWIVIRGFSPRCGRYPSRGRSIGPRAAIHRAAPRYSSAIPNRWKRKPVAPGRSWRPWPGGPIDGP